MPVLVASFKTITAERKDQNGPLSSVDINSTPKITNVKEREINLMEKQPSLQIEFEFETTYNPGLGNMKFIGDLLYAHKDVKKIAKGWEKDKKLPDDVEAEVKNFLFRRCLTFAINISDQMQLPAPLGFPTIVLKKDGENKKTNYIG